MNYLEQIKNEYENGRKAIHIECSFSIFKNILYMLKETYSNQQIGVYQNGDDLYMNMKVKEYLKFFSTIILSTQSIDDVAKRTDIFDLMKTKISKLNPSQKLRVQLARELLKDSTIFLFEQPLFELNDDDSKLIISIIEDLIDHGVFVVSCSPSFREVCLMPGNTFFYKEDQLVPINESIDNEFIGNAPETHSLDKLQVKVNGRILLIPISDIYFAESIDSVTNLYVKNSYLPTSFTLDELEVKLSRLGFFRTHRSYLVNTQKIKEVDQWTKNSYIIIIDGIDDMKVPLSKRRYKEFQESLS